MPLHWHDERNIWCRQTSVKTTQDATFSIDFKARIRGTLDGTWDMTIRVKNDGDNTSEHENQAMTQIRTLPYSSEYKIEGSNGTTFVRPVLVSLSGFDGG